jgi:DNA-binding GntR family transcriptional regulator
MSAFSEIPLHRVSTAEQVASGLTEMIMLGELAAGLPLRESVVAANLGISRNTVREAVRLLEQSGLVRHELHRGTVVVNPSLADVEELYHARLRLEVAAVSGPVPSERLDGVRRAFNDLARVATGRDAPEIVAKDLAFHAALVALLGSSRLDTFYRQLVQELRFYLMVLTVEDREYERPDFVIEEHRVIVDALEAGNAAAAVAAVSEHVRSNAARLSAILVARDEAATTKDRA